MQYDIQCKPTMYGGTLFDSSHEARWARVFDLLEWRWLYHPAHVAGIWAPDFELTIDSSDIGERPLLVEIKPERKHLPDALDKVERAFEYEDSDEDVLFLFNPDKMGEPWWEIWEPDSNSNAWTLIDSWKDEILRCWKEIREIPSEDY